MSTVVRRTRVKKAMVNTAAGLIVLGLAVVHVLFGIANFQPGFSEVEGVAAILGGLALILALAVARRSLFAAMVTACVGTTPLAAWFAYAVPVERSSDPPFFWASLMVPVFTGVAALLLRRRHRNAEG